MLQPLPENPTVSVYALTYNHEHFVADAIESVLAQNWPQDRLQFVLLDDGSTDRTPERVEPYADRLTYVRQENQGINAAVTRLVSLVDGDVLIPLSGDDMLAADRIERTVRYFREHPDVGMVYGDMEVIDEHGRQLMPSVKDEEPPTGQVAGRLLGGNFVSGGALAVRGALKPAMLGMPAEAAWEDWWFAWALTNVAPIGYIDAPPVYRYRRHRSNFMFGLARRDPKQALDRQVVEFPFRRYLLGNARPGTCTPRELLEAVDQFRRLNRLVRDAGRPQEAIFAVTDAERDAADRLTAMAAALTTRAPVLAGFAAAAALACDPLHAGAYRALHAVAGLPSTPPRFFDDVRTVTVFAEAEELAADPSLLRTYAGVIGPADDVTLVTVAREWDGARLGAELGPLVEEITGEATPDILALPADATAWVAALTQTDCALGLRDWPIPGVIRFDEGEALREFVERRRRAPLRRS
ncbi:glycosyltransferase [Solirubrobacter sp. CPCC 204708]|uniref:Glycosyltransferase n=1 Tax=Solirubrobacter deserti TaxID=2282478 RepID=A0ABT4RMJ0_9ACTN|nr:glycosyltransferase [Solirubrobacter deserti]MBE2316896.1 glycosyltransferase [Solirubrobacter deserti]MDA0139727.1 glycosyltransferase [Solirubrobacter deserti]